MATWQEQLVPSPQVGNSSCKTGMVPVLDGIVLVQYGMVLGHLGPSSSGQYASSRDLDARVVEFNNIRSPRNLHHCQSAAKGFLF